MKIVFVLYSFCVVVFKLKLIVFFIKIICLQLS